MSDQRPHKRSDATAQDTRQAIGSGCWEHSKPTWLLTMGAVTRGGTSARDHQKA